MRITVAETISVLIPIDPTIQVTLDVKEDSPSWKEGSSPWERVRDEIGIEPRSIHGHDMVTASARDVARVLAILQPAAKPTLLVKDDKVPDGETLARAIASALTGRSLAEARVTFVYPTADGLVEDAGQVQLAKRVTLDLSYEI